MKIRLLDSLKFRMPLFVILGIIPLIVVIFSFYSGRASKKIGQEAQENMALRAAMSAELVFQWDLANALALQNLSQQPDIVSMEPIRQRRVLQKLTQTYKHLYLAMVMDREGMSIARNDTSPMKNYGDRAYFLGAIAGEPITRQTIISRTNKRPAVCMATPIRTEKLETIGVSAICSNLEKISQELGQIKFGKTGYVFLVDKSGRILAHPNSSYVSGEKLRDFSTYPPVQQILEGRDGIFFFGDSQDNHWVSYGQRLDSNGWGIIVLQQKWELFNNQEYAQNLAFTVISIAVISISILVWILANHLIRPITDLTEATTAISEGQWNKRVKIKSSSEVGILANSFNKMAAQLQNSFGKLEEKIKERTAQLNQAKEAAERDSQTKDQFIANITYQLRAVSNNILNNTVILQNGPDLKLYQKHNLKLIQQSTNNLLTLINEILYYYKIVSGKVKVKPVDMNLQFFLSQIVDIARIWAKEKHIDFQYQTTDSLSDIIIKADARKLKQILINLLSNAVKFTEKGMIILKVSSLESNPQLSHQRKDLEQKTLRFEIADTGVGMSPEQLEKIFQPFKNEQNNRKSGTGLGLPITQQLLELMSSRLQVKSELTKGSVFWFDITFPLGSATKKGKSFILPPA